VKKRLRAARDGDDSDVLAEIPILPAKTR